MATIERNDSNGWFKYTLDVWESNVETGNNRSKVNWTFKITRLNKYHKWKYSRNVVWWSLNIAGNSYSGGIPEFGVNNTSETVRTLSSSSVWVGHNSDGSKSVSFSFSANSEYPSINYLPGPASNSGSMTLTRIARQANITDASNFNDEQNPTVYYSNPAGTAVTVDTCISWTGSADIGYRGVDENKSSYTYYLSSSERTTLRKACATANSKTVTFYIRTTVGGEYKYSTLNRTLSIVNATPTISPTIKDTNETTVALTGDNQKFIKGYSNAAVTIGSSAKKEAWISSNSMSNGGRTLSSNGTFNNVTNGSFSFWTRDSRGNTASKTVNKTVIDYIPLTCGIEAQPPTTDGKLTIHIKGNYFNNTFGAVTNTLTLQYRSKTNSGEYGAWETITPTFNGNTYEFTKELTGLDYKSVYTFQAQAVDKLRSITTPEKALKSLPVFDWGETDFNFNVPISIKGNPLPIYNIGQVYVSTNSTSPAEIYGGQWELQYKDSHRIPLGSVTIWGGKSGSGAVGKVNVLGAYQYQLLHGVETNAPQPIGYHVEFRLLFQGTTGGNNSLYMGINNIETNGVHTWSGNSYRVNAATKFFKDSDIVLEPTYNYSSPGTNLYYRVTGDSSPWGIGKADLATFYASDDIYYHWKKIG